MTTTVTLESRAQELVAAVQTLVSHDRVLTEQELLVATASELLVDGAATSSRVATFVNDVWAGANIAPIRVEQALHTAAAAGLMAPTTVDGFPGWSLTPSGCAGVSGAKGWAEQVFSRTRRELQDLAKDSLRELTDVEADLFVRILAQAVADAVHEAYDAYVGDVAMLADGTIKPTSFNRERAMIAVATANIAETAREFLEAAVAAALDATDPFGNELIGHLATGCILHAYLAGIDRGARKRLGSLEGEEFILETPLLVALVGPAWEAEPIEATIRVSLAQKIKVVVPEHCVDELIELVDAVEARHLEPLRHAIDSGMRARTYAASVQAGILQSWVAALDEGRYQHWSEFRVAAARLRSKLSNLGVTVRPHNNTVRETVQMCRDALATEISTSSRTGRGRTAIDRDSETMAMALRHRRGSPAHRLWPGAWVVTPDRHIGPAYHAMSNDDVPLTITAAQWSTLVSRCAGAPTVEHLAASTAPLLVRDAALAIATRYPPDVALEFAGTLSASADSTTIEAHMGSLTLDGVIDPLTGATAGDGMRLAGEVLARRTRRMQAAQEMRAERDIAEVARSKAAARVADTAAARERHARQNADEQAEKERNKRADLELQLAHGNRKLEDERVLSRRRTKLAVLMTLAGVATVAVAAVGLYVVAAATVLTMLVTWHQSYAWRHEVSATTSAIWPAVAVEALGLLQLVWSPDR